MYRASIVAVIVSSCVPVSATADTPPVPVSVSDFNNYTGDVYWVRGGRKQPYHGMHQPWVFNRAMAWLDRRTGVEDAVICYSSQSPLPLTGRKQVSRWHTGKANELSDVDDFFTRFVKKDPQWEFDQATLPSFQFPVQQHPIAELEVAEATHPWQWLIVVKGRSGPPLYASPWQTAPGKLIVDVLDLLRKKGYQQHFANLHFFVATRTKDPRQQAEVVFRLRLDGRAAIVPSLPVIRTHQRSKSEGVPIYAVVLDEKARRLGSETVEVTGSLGEKTFKLADGGSGIWKAVVRGVPVGDYRATLRAVWKGDDGKTAASTLDVHVTDGQFVGYDPKLRLLTHRGKPLGPIAGSYRTQVMFKGIGTPRESLLFGQAEWAAALAADGGPDYGFHWWESFTADELDADLAYLARCGWSALHQSQGWMWWERLDCGGRIAEQLAMLLAAARRHRVHVYFSLSLYPYGEGTPTYAQYYEAGYQKGDYGNPDSKFYRMFADYVDHFATVFRDETALFALNATGESDFLPSVGKPFVNHVYDLLQTRDGNHLVVCEPFLWLDKDPNYYRKAGWKPVLGGMRTYRIEWNLPKAGEPIAVQFKLSAMGDLFMAEGLSWLHIDPVSKRGAPRSRRWGILEDPVAMTHYRDRVRETFYTGLAYRNPALVSWEERVTEDERIVFEQVRRAVDWSRPFQTPRLAIRLGPGLVPLPGRSKLHAYEKTLSSLPLECTYVWQDDPVPPAALFAIDARQPLVEPAFVSEGGQLPDALSAEMPLRLPLGLAANYSWSQDRRTLLAFIRKTCPHDGHDTVAGGDYTTVDTTRLIERDTLVDAWEAECVKPGSIQLRLYRREGEELVALGQSEMVKMTELGMNRFSLKEPIAARKGDIIGIYIPDPDRTTLVAASRGGRWLCRAGSVPGNRTPVADWVVENKTLHVWALGATSIVKAKPDRPRKPSEILVQNFPSGKLFYRLFDLAEKKVVSQGHFEKGLALKVPRQGRHFFLLVGAADGMTTP